MPSETPDNLYEPFIRDGVTLVVMVAAIIAVVVDAIIVVFVVG